MHTLSHAERAQDWAALGQSTETEGETQETDHSWAAFPVFNSHPRPTHFYFQIPG